MQNFYRSLVKYFGRKYFFAAQKAKLASARRYAPPSGKVLGVEELDNMLDASLDMWLTAGRFSEQFEKEFAKKLGVKYALIVNSGSSANLLALSAVTSHKLGERRLKAGDEVITLAAGFPTTVAPVLQNSLIPVFVDADVKTHNVDINALEGALTPKTKAVFIAHTLGNPFNIAAVQAFCKKHNLWFIEDSCDALGAKWDGKYCGSYGDIGTFSFYPAHHITMGEGGAVVTNDQKLYRILLSLRDWGRDCWCQTGKDNTCSKRFAMQLGKLPFGYDHKYTYSHLGYNFKTGDWAAACGLAQLKKLDGFVEQRRKNFNKLYMMLKPFEDYFILPSWEKEASPSWFGLLLTIKDDAGFTKTEFCKYLEDSGVGTRSLFAGNILRQPCFCEDDIKLRIGGGDLQNSRDLSEQDFAKLPATEHIMRGSFWLGVWPGLKEEDFERVPALFEKFTKNMAAKKK